MVNYKGEEVSTEEYLELRFQDFFLEMIDELIQFSFHFPNEDDMDEEQAEKLVEKTFENYVWYDFYR
tara:strand:- start:74 stop:274 length:201 start_codon:yes stop_codon:yes gene_type:complete